MSEDQLVEEARELTRFERHKFLLLIAGTIAIALVLVGIALAMYVKNGTEQLDLSRPGYQQLGKEITKSSSKFASFSSKGPLNKSVAERFLSLYDQEAKNVVQADAFGSHSLSDNSLAISSHSSPRASMRNSD